VGLVGRVGHVRRIGRVEQVAHVGQVGLVGLVALIGVLAVACSRETTTSTPQTNTAPRDAQHQGITTPHGDHAPHHDGMVLMNGELHYEVVFDRDGRHRIWFTDAVREDLPASIARDVRMTIARPNQPLEALALDIDDAGESWVAAGKPVAGDNVMVKINYVVQGSPYEVEIPFLIPAR
jgi:hypothetical protein